MVAVPKQLLPNIVEYVPVGNKTEGVMIRQRTTNKTSALPYQ